jgi:hypothetical protein
MDATFRSPRFWKCFWKLLTTEERHTDHAELESGIDRWIGDVADVYTKQPSLNASGAETANGIER